MPPTPFGRAADPGPRRRPHRLARRARLRTLGHADPGLQPERSRMAWSRTTLAMLVVGLLAVRNGSQVSLQIGWLLATVMAVVSVVVGLSFGLDRTSIRGIREDVMQPHTGAVFALAVGVILIGLVTLVVIVEALLAAA